METAQPLLDAPLRRLLGRLRLAYRRSRGGGSGARRGRGGAGRLEVSDFRDYEPGDDLRDLDWSAYARLERLVVKEYEHASRQPVTLLIDASPSMACGAPDRWRYARRLALALGYLALLGRHALRVELLPGASHGPRDRPEAIDELARALADASTAEEGGAHTGLAGELAARARRLPMDGALVLISDLWGDRPPLERALLALQRQGRRWTVVQLLTADELDPAGAGLAGALRLEGAEERAAIELELDAGLRAAYHRELAAHVDGWRAFCTRFGLGHAQLSTGDPLEAALLGELRDKDIVSG